MNRCSIEFKEWFSDEDITAFEVSKDTIFALSDSLTFLYFNPAWFEFARKNNGEPHISEKVILGEKFETFITGKLKKIYLLKFKKVLHTGKSWEINYECSSKNKYRIYRQMIVPIKKNKGLLVVNSLLLEDVMKEQKRNKLRISDFMDEKSYFNQCSNCRKTKLNKEEKWIWLPELIDTKIANISHTICPVCYELYWK